jgi:hypothetical protein
MWGMITMSETTGPDAVMDISVTIKIADVGGGGVSQTVTYTTTGNICNGCRPKIPDMTSDILKHVSELANFAKC